MGPCHSDSLQQILTAKVTTILIIHMVKLLISCFCHPMHERQLIHTKVINAFFYIGKYKSETEPVI
jgi:hypothetical protein